MKPASTNKPPLVRARDEAVCSTNAAVDAAWSFVQLGEVADIVGGIQKTPDRSPSKFHRPFLTVRNVQRGVLDLTKVERFEVTPDELSRFRLQRGDLLIVEGNGSVDHIGRNALFCEEGEWIHQNHIIRVRLPPDRFAPEFISLFLNSHVGRAQMLEKAKTTTGLYTLSAKKIASLSVPSPSLTVQRRVSERLRGQLEEVNRTSAALQAQLDSAQLFIQAVLRESLNAPGCVTVPVPDCLQEVTQGIGERWSDFPVLGATRAGLAPAKEGVGKNPGRYKPVVPGTIFYNPMRILLGSIAMLDDGDASGITSPDYVVVRGVEGRLHPVWFYHWFRSRYGAEFILSLTRGAVRERLLFNRLAKASLTIPAWPTQLRAVEQFRELKTFKQAATARLETIALLPTALLRQAFFPA